MELNGPLVWALQLCTALAIFLSPWQSRKGTIFSEAYTLLAKGNHNIILLDDEAFTHKLDDWTIGLKL